MVIASERFALIWFSVTKSFCWVIAISLPSICPLVVTSFAKIVNEVAACNRPCWLLMCNALPLIAMSPLPVTSPCWLCKLSWICKSLCWRLWILPCRLSTTCAESVRVVAKIPWAICLVADFVSRLLSVAVLIFNTLPLSINDPVSLIFWLLMVVLTFSISASFVRISPPRLSTWFAWIAISPKPWILPRRWLSSNPLTERLPRFSA